MYRTDDKDIWRVFRQHHYLSAELNKAATCYTIYWDNVLVGFQAILPMPSGTLKYAKRNSRTVILPDYQNLGIGTRVVEFLGDYYLGLGYKYFMRSTHLRLSKHWQTSDKWLTTSSNGKVSNKPCSTSTIKQGVKDRELNRIAYSAEYMGKDYATKEHIYIHIDDNTNIDYNILEQDLIYLKEKYWVCVITGEINTPNEIENICLRNGIRTQLLYTTKKGVAKLNNAYKNKKILTSWTQEFSDRVRRRY